MTKEEDYQKNMALIEYYKEQLKALELQFSYLQNAIIDQTKAKITLETLSKSKKESELLLPIGGGAFINAIVTNPNKILFEVGEGIVVEKKANDAAEKISKRIEELQKTEEKISSMAQQLQIGAAEASEKVEKILANKD
jgi:prefoldin alpha subunit